MNVEKARELRKDRIKWRTLLSEYPPYGQQASNMCLCIYHICIL